jgi:acetyltransferase-like isoleucine patch superfamily enzyme
VNGECRIGNDVFIGSGSVLRETVSVCDNVILGLGSLVIRSVEEEGTYVGQPIRKLTHA